MLAVLGERRLGLVFLPRHGMVGEMVMGKEGRNDCIYLLRVSVVDGVELVERIFDQLSRA